MFAVGATKTQVPVLNVSDVHQKLNHLSEAMAALLSGAAPECVPKNPGRDVQIWPIRELPAKKGLSTIEGQARLIHDLASIELQAMELGLRTLIEFPNAPMEFRQELAIITQEEGMHLQLCLQALEALGRPWGSYPTHVGLWYAVSEDDSLLDRIAIVHRYLEGSGLDASDTILRRLEGVKAEAALKAVRVIRRDEVAHVKFGSFWYHRLVRHEGGDVETDFADRLTRLFDRIPRRMEPVCHSVRQSAGFLPQEIQALENVRERFLTKHAMKPFLNI